MAATLIHIKSRLLIPRPTADVVGEDDEEDPREALVRRLLEHQKFKAAAELLHERQTLRAAQYPGPMPPWPTWPATTTSRSSKSTCSACWRRSAACSSAPKSGRTCCCRPSRCRSSSASSSCSSGCRRPRRSGFEELFADANSRPALIVTFLALLEMIRLKLIRVFQAGPFGPDPRLQARAAAGCAASDHGSGSRVRIAPPEEARPDTE